MRHLRRTVAITAAITTPIALVAIALALFLASPWEGEEAWGTSVKDDWREF